MLCQYRDGIHSMLLEPAWKNVSDPIEKIFALLGVYRRLLLSTECLYGCPIGSLALELHEPDPAVRKLLAANFAAWKRAVQRCLETDGARIPKDIPSRELATFVLTIMEGGVMQARTHRNIAAFDTSVRVLRDYLTRLQCARPPVTRRRLQHPSRRRSKS